MTVPLWMVVGVSVVERSVGLGSGSSQAASLEVAFLAEPLCFANLTLSFLAGCHVNGLIMERCRMRNCYLLCKINIVSVATARHGVDKISQRAIAQTDIKGRRAVSWCHEKAAFDRYSGGG